jgi:hypothetical protein
LGELRPNLLTILRHFTKHAFKPHLNRIGTSPKSAKLNLLTSSLASILLAFPIHATTTADIYKSHLSMAISLLDSAASCINTGPIQLATYRDQISKNVGQIKASIATRPNLSTMFPCYDLFITISSDFSSNANTFNTNLDDADTDLTATVTAINATPTSNYRSDIASNIAGIKTYINAASPKLGSMITYNDSFSTTYPQFAAYLSSISISSILNSTTLILIDCASISSTAVNSLGNYTSMIIVKRYNPTNLTYSSMTNLVNLRMYDGGDTVDSAVRNAISTLAKGTNNKLRYLEVSHWGTTSIAAEAFARTTASDGANSIQELVGFEDVTTVGYRAFCYCTNLKSVSLPNVTTLAEQLVSQVNHSDAFIYCSWLTTLSLPLLRTAVGYAFYCCSGLTTLSLPLIETAGQCAFATCAGLTTLSLPLLSSVGNGAFIRCSGLKTLSLPKLRTIELDAFNSCFALQDITLSDNLLSVATSAFNGTSNVTTLRLVGHTSTNGIFGSCGMLANTTLNGSITNFYYILGRELRGSSALTTYINTVLNLPRTNVTLFKNSSTHGILDLSRVCDSFDYSVTSGNVISYILPVLYYRTSVTNLSTLQNAEDLTVVGNYTTTGLTAANYQTFTKLKSLRLFEGNMTTELLSAIRNLAKNASPLTHLEISSCDTIPDNAFEGCTSLQKFVGENVTSVGASAFSGCTNLTTVELSELTSLGASAFSGCTKLTVLFMPNLKKANVGANAFHNVPDAAIPGHVK